MSVPEGWLDLSLLMGYRIGGEGVGRTCYGRPLGNGYFELEAPLGARLLLSGTVRGPPNLSRQGQALAVVDAERLSGECEVPAAAGSLVLRMVGPLRHAPAPEVTLLAIEGISLPRTGDLPVEEAGEDRLRYRSIPPGSVLAIEGLDVNGRTLRREVAYEGPEALELDWPSTGVEQR
jgi:hypothetical protein